MADELNTEPTDDVTDDKLSALPPDRLAQMVRDKRKAEAGVRAKLRDAETERDRLSGVVSSFQQSAFDETARARKVAETALPDLSQLVPLADVLGEDGLLDTDKASAALDELQRARPHLFDLPKVAGASGTGMAGHTGETTRAEPATWADVLG